MDKIRIMGLMTCFNRKEKTILSIHNLMDKNNNVQFDFCIADDNSTDGTKEALKKFENITVLNGNGNLYYSGGMRLVMEYVLEKDSKYDYCLLFNDDVEFLDNVIDKMIDISNNDKIIVGPTCDLEGKLSYGGIIKKSRLRPNFKIVDGNCKEGMKCDTFNANCVLIPWHIFEKLGTIDKKYSHSLGDFDYGFSASRMGYQIQVCDFYVGVCCDNDIKGSWRDTTLKRKIRLIKKESPKGLPRKEWWHYLRKNYSIMTACIFSITPYVKILLKK